MSIVRLRKLFRKKIDVGIGKRRISMGSPMEIIFWVIVVIFLVGAFYTFGGPSSQGGRKSEQGTRNVSKIVAVVDGKEIPRAEFDSRYQPRIRDVPQTEFVTADRRLKTGLLDAMIERLLMLAAVKKEGITASRADIEKKADELVQQELDQRFPNRKALAKYLRSKQKSMEQIKAEMKKKLLEDTENLKETVLFQRLEDKIKSRVVVSDKDLEDNYTKIKAQHILIKPDELKAQDEKNQPAEATNGESPEATNGESAAENKPAAPADKNKDYKALAKQKAEELLARIKQGEDFSELAKQFSNDPGSAKEGGMLRSSRPPEPGADAAAGPSEFFGHGEMVPAFDKAAFALAKDQVSGVVETDFGYHIIKLLDRKTEYPPDYDKKKQDFRNELLEKKKGEAWTEYQGNLKKAAKIEVQDPELAAYRAADDGKQPEAIQLLAKAVQDDPQNAGAKYELATMLKSKGDADKAIQLLKELTENERAANSPQVHMDLADLYSQKQMKKEAIEEYKAASEWAQTYDYQSMFMHQQIKTKFEEAGEQQLVAQEQQWLDEFNKQMKENPGAGMMGGPGGMSIPVMPSPTGQ